MENSIDSDNEELLDEKIRVILATLTHHATFKRNMLILETLLDHPNHNLLRKEIESILSDKLPEKDLSLIGSDLSRLVSVNLVQNRSNRYRLTPIGAIIHSSIVKTKLELSQPIVDQLTRAMIHRSIYEGEGLPIQSHKQVSQICHILRETIQDIIEQDKILEWTEYLDRLNEIIVQLDDFCMHYKDQPMILRQLNLVKSELEVEVSRFHEAARKSVLELLSFAKRGIDPKELRRTIDLFEEDHWETLERSLNTLFLNEIRLENEVIWQDYLEEEKIRNLEVNKTIIRTPLIRTQILVGEDAKRALEMILPDYKRLGVKISSLIDKKDIITISNLLRILKANKWEDSSKLIGNLPAIEKEYSILAFPQKKKLNTENGWVSEGFILNKGEKNHENS